MSTSTDRPRTLLSMAPSVYLPAMVFEIGNGAVAPVIAITALDLGASAGTAGLLLSRCSASASSRVTCPRGRWRPGSATGGRWSPRAAWRWWRCWAAS